MSRFYQGDAWRWLVLAVDNWAAPELRIVTFLDGLTLNAAWDRVLNEPNVCTLTVPADNPEVYLADAEDGEPFVAEGVRCIVGLRRENPGPEVWWPRASGVLLQPTDAADVSNGAGVGYSTLVAPDPWQLLYRRPVCYFDGTLPDADTGLKFADEPADNVALALLFNTEAAHGPTLIDSSLLPGNELDPITITFERGLTVGEAWKQLCDAGYMDIALDPILDLGGGYISRLRIAEKIGQDRYEAVFAYAAPGSSLAAINRGEDGTLRANKVKEYNGSGGPPIPRGNHTTLTNHTSVAMFGESWLMKAQPQLVLETTALRIAQADLDARAFGVTTISVNPMPERCAVPLSEYDIGDTVTVLASPTELRKRVVGQWRVTKIPIRLTGGEPETVESLDVNTDEVLAT